MSARQTDLPSTNGSTPASSKKRKASVLGDDTEPVRKADSPPRHKPQAKTQSQQGDEIPFVLVCPAKPPKSKRAEDVFRDREETGLPEGSKHLAVNYSIRPGTKWTAMRAYKNVKLSNQTFSVGSTIYVNRTSPAPAPPPDDASDEEILQWDRQNLWVGRLIECRAASDRDVYLRVLWLYWPDELPQGRQPYHSGKELVMSNAMDIIDATAIASAAEVSEWDETDEEADADLKERFWRQTLDVNRLGKLGNSMAALSALRTHCVCETEYNPDSTMFKCVAPDCGLWNHEECLVEAILEKTYDKALKGTFGKDKDVALGGRGGKPDSPRPIKSLTSRMMTEIFSATARFLTPDTLGPQEPEERGRMEERELVYRGPESKKRKKPDGSRKPWDGKFSCTVSNTDPEGEKGRVLAHITDLRATKGKGKNADRNAHGDGEEVATEWTEGVRCLRCNHVLE